MRATEVKISPIIVAEMEEDLNHGVFDKYLKLKSRIEYLVFKINMSKYVLNSCYFLTDSDISFLNEQGYKTTKL